MPVSPKGTAPLVGATADEPARGRAGRERVDDGRRGRTSGRRTFGVALTRASTTSVLAAMVVGPVALLPVSATADVWVFEPSISLDQRLDDNYRLETELQRRVSATRLVGDLGLSRESRTTAFRGGIRVDGLLTAGEYEGDELDSNQVFFLDTVTGNERTKWGVDVSFKQDTPSRDISADLSSDASAATDSGVVTQRSNVARRQYILAPRVTRELSRRAGVEAQLTFTAVDHDLPSPSDAIYTRYVSLYNLQNAEGAGNTDLVPETASGEPLPFDQVGADTRGIGVFTPDGELDDYQDARVDLSYRYDLSPISLVSATVSHSYYRADSEPADALNTSQASAPNAVAGLIQVRDGQTDIYRKPRGRDALSTTSSFRLGYERDLTPTLQGGVQVGVYLNTTDDSDTFRDSDRAAFRPPFVLDPTPDNPFNQRPQTADEYAATLESEQDGWLANVTLTKDAGLTRFSGRFGVDVQPSSIGSQVEAQELILDASRTLSPLLDVSFRLRAYEPDRLGANPNDRFARRFLSLEPKVVWRFTRAWTASASYRYRRQKSRVETESGESNALLFSLRYTPPSAIRDAANRTGL